MATVIPALASCVRRMSAGEKRLAQRLDALLDEQWLCWYDVAFGPKHQHPDFVLLHPQQGLLVLELRDWKIDQILSVGQLGITVLADGYQELSNPFEQARQYALSMSQALHRDPHLCARESASCPVGHGLVLSNITRKEFERAQLGEAWPAHCVICKDEMTESVDAEQFKAKLSRMVEGGAPSAALTALQIDRIRYHLFPELRIKQGSLFIGGHESEDLSGPLPVMDLHQEKLARSLGEGHRVVHGVAGSGKTMILAYRCSQLAKRTDKPVLVLCYNSTLAAKLTQLIHNNTFRGRVIVRHFHGWCLDQLRLHRLELPATGPGLPGRLVRAVTQAVSEQRIPTAQYSAVLIDEGHDFEPQWFKLLAQMVDPDSNSLLLLYDDAQGIYGKKRSRDFSFAKVGIQARGRTTILRVNYRNSAEVLDYAYQFAQQSLVPEDNNLDDDAIPFISPLAKPVAAKGARPELKQCSSLEAEAKHIAEQLMSLHEQGCAWQDMAVLYPSRLVGETLARVFEQLQLPVDWLQVTPYNPDADRIKLMTLHKSKGLEFAVVAIAGLGFMPYQDDEAMEDTRLLYVGMTRAVQKLILTSHQHSTFVEQLVELQPAKVRNA